MTDNKAQTKKSSVTPESDFRASHTANDVNVNRLPKIKEASKT